jgi:hypothetical protein
VHADYVKRYACRSASTGLSAAVPIASSACAASKHVSHGNEVCASEGRATSDKPHEKPEPESCSDDEHLAGLLSDSDIDNDS